MRPAACVAGRAGLQLIRRSPTPSPPSLFLSLPTASRLFLFVVPSQNKTLRAIFNNKHVLELMEKNYRTFCALNSIQPAASEQIKEVVLKILDNTQLGDKRSSKLEQDDFLKSIHTHAQWQRSGHRRWGKWAGVGRLAAVLMSLCYSDCACVTNNRLLASFNQAGFHFNTGVGIDEPEEIEED